MIDSNANGSTQPNLPVSRLATDARLHFAYTIFCAAAHGVTFNSELWNEEYSDAALTATFSITPILYCVMALYENCLIRDESEIARILFESTSMAPLLYMCLYISLARPPDHLSARVIDQAISLSIANGAYISIFLMCLIKFCFKTQPEILKVHKCTMLAWLGLLSSMLSGGLPIPVMAQSCLVLAVLTIIAGQGKAYHDLRHSQLFHPAPQGPLGVGLFDVAEGMPAPREGIF